MSLSGDLSLFPSFCGLRTCLHLIALPLPATLRHPDTQLSGINLNQTIFVIPLKEMGEKPWTQNSHGIEISDNRKPHLKI